MEQGDQDGRSEKTGAYVFEERMVPNDKVQDWLK